MKVTVCFGSIRIVVPCGTGELLVRDLINESIRRYRKATAKDQDAWVIVHHLQTQSGILDPDDRVNDVADDREQILASFEDSGPDPGVQQGGGDGASGSSVGTNSPDIFRGVPEIKYVVENITDSNNNVNTNSNNNNNINSNTNSTNNGTNNNNNGNISNNNITPHIEVTVTTTNQQTQSGLGLQVRRSSDPSIHQIELPSDSRNLLLNNNVKQVTHHQQDPTKRWSAAPVCRDAAVPDQLPQPQLLLTKPLIYSDKLIVNGAGNNALINENGINIQRKNIHYLSPSWENEESQQQLDDDGGSQPIHAGTSLAHSPFSRSGRLSMQFLGGDGYKWMDAADKLMAPNTVGTSTLTTTTTVTNNSSGITTNPLLTAYNSKSLPRDTKQRKEPLGQAAYESMRCEKTLTASSKFGEMLLIINEYGGPLGLTAIPDEENGGLLVQSVEIGSCADRGRLRRGDRILEINGHKLIGLAEQSVLDHLKRNCTASELRVRVIRSGSILMNRNAINSSSDGGGNHVKLVQRLKKEIIEMQEAEEKTSQTKVATVSPTRKMPGQSVTSGTVALQTANTRKLGRKIEISLKKGLQGLGFSVTTRDNPAGGHCPIYIKTILPRGAAIEDGRLRPGDRLLEVDGVTMTGKSQSEVVGILRSTQSGATVNIVVSRHQESTEAEREIGFNGYHEHNDVMNDDNTTPPKPPPPVLPQKSNFIIKPNGILKEKNLNDKNFIETDGNDDSIPYENPQHITSSPTISAHSTNSWRNREILTLHIPVHDTEKAGLGVSVKGKTGSPNSSNGSNNSSTGSKQHDGDLGIFVKSVLHGGAASRDGRLKTNDQLLNVNGISLLGQSNAEAMETLRKAMVHTGGKYPGMITLTVSRRIRQNSNSSNKMNNSNNNHNLINGQIDTYDTSNHSNSSSTTASEQSGKTVIYLSSATDNKQNEQKTTTNVGIKNNHNLTNNNYNTNASMDATNTKRWSNPVLDRLTGGTGHLLPSVMQSTNSRTLPTHMTQHNGGGLRNESYYIATNDNWSPNVIFNGNNSVLIEEDPEPASPTIKLAMNRMYDNHNNSNNNNSNKQQPSSTQQMPSSPTVTSTSTTSTNGNCDITYSSQLSLETNPPNDAFSRDAIGRRSMSEKHHAALDAKETGTYQRNKKLREDREREKHGVGGSGSGGTKQHYPMNSMDSLINNSSNHNNNFNMHATHNHLLNDLNLEAMDRVGDLGPSLGLKKSSSLESLQTMVQEIQMSDEPRGPMALRAPRGRGREDSLRAAVERPPTENKPRKHWLLEDGPSDTEGGFINRHGPFQGSLNEGKPKHRHKKPSILKGIGHMFRFGKHRKDGVCPTEASSEISGHHQQHPPPHQHESNSHKNNTIHYGGDGGLNDREKQPGGPPNYQPPAAPALTTLPNGNINSSSNGISSHNHNNGNNNNAIQHNDIFNHRYSHYVNYDELQQHLSPQIERLSETTIAQMRLQVMHQRVKVEEESRRHHHYHSQRSTSSSSKSNHLNEYNTAAAQSQPPQQQAQQQQQQHQQPHQSNHLHQRPISSYYEYETIQQSVKKYIAPSPPTNKWNGNLGGSGRLPSSSSSTTSSSINNHHRNGGGGGPFVTQITIRDQQQQKQKQQQQPQLKQQQPQHHQHHHQIGQQPASKV